MHVIRMIGALALLAATPVAAQDVVGFGTLPPGSMANAMMNAIVKVVSIKENLPGVVQPHAGSTQYLPLLNRGELDFANTNALDAHFAKQGIEIFTSPNANLRMATVIYPLRQQILVRKDSAIKSFADLKGKRLVGGYQAQRSVQVLLDGLLAAGGLTMSDVQMVPIPNVVRGLEEFERGRADASLGAMEMPKVREVAAQRPGIVFLSSASTPAALAAMQKIAPPAYLDEVKPSAAQPGMDGPTVVQAYDYVLLTRADLPDEVVYKVVKAMHDNKGDLEAAVPGFREFTPGKMAKPSTVDYHPGAIKFYTEKGLWPPKG